jgi:hypothetical protein
VVEISQNLTLVAEASEQIGGIHAAAHEFDRNLFLEMLVVAGGEKDRAHAAASDFPHDPPDTE